MKSSCSLKYESDTDDSSTGDIYLNTNYLRKSIDELTISVSNYSLEADKVKLIKSEEKILPGEKSANILSAHYNVTGDSINKSKSLTTLSNIDKTLKDRDTRSLNHCDSKKDLKLVSPCANWCGFV